MWCSELSICYMHMIVNKLFHNFSFEYTTAPQRTVDWIKLNHRRNVHRDERCEFQKVVIYEKDLFYELQPIVPCTILTSTSTSLPQYDIMYYSNTVHLNFPPSACASMLRKHFDSVWTCRNQLYFKLQWEMSTTSILAKDHRPIQ